MNLKLKFITVTFLERIAIVNYKYLRTVIGAKAE